MNRLFAEKLLATVFVLALFGGIYFLIQTFTAEKEEGIVTQKPVSIMQTEQRNLPVEPVISAVEVPRNSIEAGEVKPYYYLEDFYVESGRGLVLKTYSDPQFQHVLTTNLVKRPVIDGPMLKFTEIQNGKSQQQYFNLEALVNQLNS